MGTLIWSMLGLLLSIALLMAGSGMFSTFISLRATMEGIPKEGVGLMMTAFYLGLILGTFGCGRLINRVGHIRAFAAFAATSAATVVLFSMVVSLPVWVLLRGVLGFNLAGAFMVAESWLNTRATAGNRATLLGVYTMVGYLAMSGGQLMINIGDHGGYVPFVIANLMLCLAVVPVAITRATHPEPVATSRLGLRRLYRIAPLSTVACLFSGVVVGASFGMGPIFGQGLGLTVSQISQLMGVMTLGGLCLQLPLGRLSDRVDRRWVLAGATVVTALASGGLMLGDDLGLAAILALAATFGGFTATLYPIGVAYANDSVEAHDMVAASASLLLAFSIGAATGPASAAAVMAAAGPKGLFAFTCAAAVAYAIFFAARTARGLRPVREKEAFTMLPMGDYATPVQSELTPAAKLPEDAEAPAPRAMAGGSS